MDRIDRQILALLLVDGRATYQELGRQVRLSANTVADRVRRLQSAGVVRGYRAELNPCSGPGRWCRRRRSASRSDAW
ncbi:Lrp/AsnC family transcriptional regulator [Streptomyces sp. NPDC002586]